jgi:hypothetical protein
VFELSSQHFQLILYFLAECLGVDSFLVTKPSQGAFHALLNATEGEHFHAALIRADVQAKHVAILKAHSALYTSLCPNQIIDERARVLIKDCILNAISNQYLLTNGPSEPTKFITISTVASELGHHFDSPTLIKIGKIVKQEYIKKYNTEPPKHEQIVAGAVRPVCTYQAKDRDLIESAIKTFVSE